MPTALGRPKDDVELFKALSFQKGDLVERHVFDDARVEQGSILAEVRSQGCRAAAGLWFVGPHVLASGSYYRWWLKEGGGQQYMRDCWFQFCAGDNAQTCVVKVAGGAPVAHVLDLRHIFC